MVKQQIFTNFKAKLKEYEIVCHMKKLLFKKVLLVKGGGLSQVGCPFLGGLRSEWMKSGHGGRGGQKRPKMGGRPLYTVPYC